MPQRHVYTALILFGIFILTYHGFSTYNTALLLGMALIPVGIFLVNHPVLWVMLSIIVVDSTLRVPGAPEKFGVYELMLFGLAGMLVAYRIVDKKTVQPRAANRVFLMLFAGLLVFTMLYRGIGIKALGSPLWGGSVYIILILGIVFMLFIDMLKISTRSWLIAVLGMCALSLLPLVAQIALNLSHGSLYWLYNYVKPVGFLTETFQAQASGTGVERYNSGFAIVLLYVPLILFKKPFTGWALPITVGLAFLTLLVIALSGSRYIVLLALLFVGIWSMIGGRRLHWRLPLVLASVGFVALCLMAYFAIYLPMPVQRALSWVPFANTSIEASISGTTTMDWRFYIWRRAINDLLANPQWFGIGQGLAFDPSGFEGLDLAGEFSHEWAFVCRAYHHGVLSLLLIFGIPGLVIGSGVLITTAWRHFKLSQQPCDDLVLNRIYRVMLAMFCARMILFLSVGGDVQNYFPTFLFLGALLEGIARSRRESGKEVEEEEAPVFASPIPSKYALGHP